MRLFGRNPNSSKPSWAIELSNGEYRKLREAIELQLTGSGLVYSWADGDDGMNIELSDRYTAVARFDTLATKYRLADDLERPILVADHMNVIIQNVPPPTDWEEARPLLKAALVPPDYLQGEDIGPLQRPVTDEFVAVLMLDQATSVHTVLPATFAAWGVSLEEAWQIGIERIHDEPVITEEDTALKAGVKVHAVFGKTRFGSARALDVPRYLDADLPYGALVAVPSADIFLCYTIQSQAYEIARDFLHQVTADLFSAEEIAKLSPHLYWWQPTGWTRLTTVDADHRLQWDPPPTFREMAANLPAAI